MVTNWSDKERSGYLAEQRDANSSVSTGSTNACLIKFCDGGKVVWKKWKSDENALATAFRSSPAATTGNELNRS